MKEIEMLSALYPVMPYYCQTRRLFLLLALLASFGFAQPASAATTVNDTDSGFTYSGTGWFYNPGRGAGDFQDDVHATPTNGDSASYSFTGTSVSYVTEINTDEGNVQVYLDGTLQATVSCNGTRKVQQTVYTKTGLPSGSHTLKLVKQDGQYMLVDAVQVTAAQTAGLINDTSTSLTYTGAWFYSATRNLGDYQDDVHATQNNGDAVSYTFTGTGISILTETYTDEGNVQVFLDGTLQATVNCNSSIRKVQQVVWSISSLSSGNHTLKLVKQDGQYMLLDALQTQTAPAQTLTSIVVSPASATVNFNGTQQFAATALDQNGNALSPQPALIWSVDSGGVGAVSTAGSYSAATTAGSATVQAKSGIVSGSTTVTVALSAPTTPTGLQATSTDAFVSLTWQPVGSATSYNLYRTSSLTTAPIAIQSVSDSSSIDSTISLGQTYYYQVSALNAVGESPLSSPVSITPTGNLNPVVKMTAPSSGITLTAGTNLLLTAAAMPRSGTINTIGFYYAPAQYDGSGNPVVAVGTLIGTTSASPYSLIWNSLPSGSFFLTAVATDSGGHTATSAPIAVTVSAPVSGTALTSAQAIQIAQTFCRAIGAPIGTGMPTSATVNNASPTYIGSVWQVNFQGAASVEVADATGIVISYFNYTLANQLNANSQAPGTPITQAQAQTIAATILQASQQPAAELANQQFTQSSLFYPATYAGDLWTVRWNRAAAGIPYRSDQATLLLQAETGSVEAWKLAFPTPAPASTTSNVSQSQAQQIAQAEMTAAGSYLGLTNQVFQIAHQAVVQPNTLWPVNGSSTPGTMALIPGSPSRVVWDCYFSNAPASGSPSGSTYSEVWVDAVTGQIIGGDTVQVMGHTVSEMKLRPLVPMARTSHTLVKPMPQPHN